MGLEGGDDDAVKSLKMLKGGRELSTGKGQGGHIRRHAPPYPPLSRRTSPPQGGDRLGARSWPAKSLEIADSTPCQLLPFHKLREGSPSMPPSISPLEGEMSGRTEGVGWARPELSST